MIDQVLELACLHLWLDGLNRYGCEIVFRPLKIAAGFYAIEEPASQRLSGGRGNSASYCLTQHIHEVIQDWQRVVISYDSEEQAYVHDVILPFELFRNRFMDVECTE